MIWNQIEAAYRNAVHARVDETKAIFYFSSEDFPGLKKQPLAIHSSKGHRLQGYFYSYPDPKPGRIVVFEHGMGSGPRGYMKEIEILAKNGYLVFAYDHTGCMESGGEETGGFAQSLTDLNDVLRALKKNPDYRKYDFSVVGHSWGAFSALNVTKLHPDVSHIIAISGFVSVKAIMKQSLGIFYRRLYRKEREKNPDGMRPHAVRSLMRAKGKVLVIHSTDDKTVSFKKHFCVMREALAGYENINFLPVSGKGHNPNYTEAAVRYKDQFFKAYRRALKKNLFETERDMELFAERFDWDAMTQQDMTVWEKILATLEA